MFNYITNFFDHPFFIVVGGLSALLALSTTVCILFLVIKNILPVWYRLGISLSKRKIAVFAESNDFNNLKNTLVDSGLFKEKNIKRIDASSINSAESESLLLVHWKSFKEHLNEILSIKKDAAALLVYAPTDEGRIEDEPMKKLGKHRNTIVVNFRGRLINDILICMMTSRKK